MDVNLGRRLADALRTFGHDVAFVGDRDPRMPDEDVLALAGREHRILVTLDTDFGELAARSGSPRDGILLLRIASVPPAEKVRVLQEIIDRYGAELPGHLCVYRSGRLRVRQLYG